MRLGGGGIVVVGVPLVIQRRKRHMRSLELADDSEERVRGKRGCPQAGGRLRNSLVMLIEPQGGGVGIRVWLATVSLGKGRSEWKRLGV